MRSRALAAVLLGCVILVGLPAAAEAPSPATKRSAEADAAKANKALAAHDFAGAAESWERAYRQVPNPKWIFGAANARKRNGDLARAANDYARYLKEAPASAPQRAAAKKELAAITSKLGQLDIKADGATAISVDSEAIDLPLAGPTYVTAGTHLVEARFKEETVKESPTARAGAVTTVTLTPPAASAAPAPVAEGVAEPAPLDKPAPRERPRPLPPLAVYVGAGVTAIAGGLSILSGLDVLSQKDTFDAERSQRNLDDGKSKQLRTNVLIGVTITAAVLTGVAAIWFVDWRRSKTDTQVKVGAGPGALVLRATF